MDEILVMVALVCTTFFLARAVAHYFASRNVPPGPKGIPFLGYIPLFRENAQQTILNLSKKYGNIMSVYLGSQLTIVISDYKAMVATFSQQAEVFSGRAQGSALFRIIGGGGDGEVHGIADDTRHSMIRAATLTMLRELGRSESKFEYHVLAEVDDLLKRLADRQKAPFDPHHDIYHSISNMIFRLCFGQPAPDRSLQFAKYIEGLQLFCQVYKQVGPLQSFPILQYLPSFMCPIWGRIKTVNRENRQFLLDQIAQHRLTYKADVTRDFIDTVLHLNQSNPSKFDESDDRPLQQILRAFSIAGISTPTVTLHWILLFILHHPEVQKEVHRELDAFSAETDTLITMNDRIKLPYTEAVIRETQRLANTTPFGIVRSNIQDASLMGYDIPRGSNFIVNFLAINQDPTLWKDPAVFEPRRFLDEEGKLFEPPYFMPFSIGKRACVAPAIGRMMLFLVFANMMKFFEFEHAGDSPLPSTTESIMTLSRDPLPFNVNVRSRNPRFSSV